MSSDKCRLKQGGRTDSFGGRLYSAPVIAGDRNCYPVNLVENYIELACANFPAGRASGLVHDKDREFVHRCLDAGLPDRSLESEGWQAKIRTKIRDKD